MNIILNVIETHPFVTSTLKQVGTARAFARNKSQNPHRMATLSHDHNAQIFLKKCSKL